MIKASIFCACLMFLALLNIQVADAATQDREILPPEFVRGMQAAETVELYSLEPDFWKSDSSKNHEKFNEWPVLGRAEIKAEEIRLSLDEITRGVKKFKTEDLPIAGCFNPRVGLRFKSNGHTYDVLICYQCAGIKILEDQRSIEDTGFYGSALVFNQLLTKHNIQLPYIYSEKARAEEKKKQEQEDAADKRWHEAMPESLRPLWTGKISMFGLGMFGGDKSMEDSKRAFSEAIAKQYPTCLQRVPVLFAWYGSGTGRWSGYPSYEDAAEYLLEQCPIEDIVSVAKLNTLTNPQIEGAARLFADWNFNQHHPEAGKTLSTALKLRLLEHVRATAGNDKDKLARAQNAYDKRGGK